MSGPGFSELGCHPVQASVHLMWVEPVGNLANLLSDALQVRVDLGLTRLGVTRCRTGHAFNVAPVTAFRAASM